MGRIERIKTTLEWLNTEWSDGATRVDSIAVFDSQSGRGLARVASPDGSVVKLPFAVDGERVMFRGAWLALAD